MVPGNRRRARLRGPRSQAARAGRCGYSGSLLATPRRFIPWRGVLLFPSETASPCVVSCLRTQPLSTRVTVPLPPQDQLNAARQTARLGERRVRGLSAWGFGGWSPVGARLGRATRGLTHGRHLGCTLSPPSPPPALHGKARDHLRRVDLILSFPADSPQGAFC